MLSLLGVFRAATRRPLLCARQLSRAALPPAANTVATDLDESALPTNLDALSDYIMDSIDPAEEQSVEPGIATLPVGVAPVKSGYPVLKGFVPNSFIQPRDLSRDGQFSRPPYRRRAKLGPSVAESRRLDIFHQLNLNPLKECQNTALMSRFVTTMGKIRSRNETNLTWKNQRKLGKAIRRAKMMGVIPVHSRRGLLHTDWRS